MINAKSAVASDIAKHLKGFDFDNVQFDSKVKRIRRFFNNNLFDPINFYDFIIKHVIATNGDYKHTIIDFGYRFGGIEFLFKSQKTNGFYLEECGIKNLHAFDNLYFLVCIANLYLTCLGTEISKNSRCYKDLGITITRRNPKTNNTYRVISRFKSGLTLFKMAVNSTRKFRLHITFTLYDT